MLDKNENPGSSGEHPENTHRPGTLGMIIYALCIGSIIIETIRLLFF